MSSTRDKISNLQNAIWKIRDAKELVKDTGIILDFDEMTAQLEAEIDLLWLDDAHDLLDVAGK